MNLAAYRAALLECGASVAEADDAVDALAAEHAALDRMRCPKCGAGLSKRRDDRQIGPTEADGEWFNYRCTCGYACDRVEPVE